MHRTRVTLALAFTLLLALPLAAAAEPVLWVVDPVHSGVAFDIRHFFTKVPGLFSDFEGTIHYDAENPAASKVEFTIEATSIDTGNEQRDEHLRSPDFFDVEENPTWSFTSKTVEAGAGDTLQVTGDLTIAGVTREVTIPVEFHGSGTTPMGPRAGFSTQFTVDRTDYGIEWNRALEGGGAVLGDEVGIEIDIEATQPREETQE